MLQKISVKTKPSARVGQKAQGSQSFRLWSSSDRQPSRQIRTNSSKGVLMKTASAILIITIIVLATLGNAYATSYTYTYLTYDNAPYTAAIGINNGALSSGTMGTPRPAYPSGLRPERGNVHLAGLSRCTTNPCLWHTVIGVSLSEGTKTLPDGTAFCLNGGTYTGVRLPRRWSDRCLWH